MARSAILSNGRLCVGLDEKGFVNDFYYPFVGLDNMTSARFVHHKIGVWVDGEFSWLDNSEWRVSAGLDDSAMMSRVRYESSKHGIALSFRDFVDVSYDFFGRVIIVENHRDSEREIRLFFGQVFQISDAGRVDTALYGPSVYPYILTYHGNLAFVAGLRTQEGDPFDQFAVGNYGIEGKAGTYLDAEDGELSGNLVEHGGVDSIIRTSFNVKPKSAYHLDYWVCASDRNYHHAVHVHRHLSSNGLYHYLNATSQYWHKWLNISKPFIDSIDVKYQSLARKSLLTIKAHCDENGGILASADSSIYNYGRDYYNYIWPRDAGYALMPLLKAGYTKEVRDYLNFSIKMLHPKGYAHHKYLPDSSLGSTWHPLMQDNVSELNIQEDETASLLLLAHAYLDKVGTKGDFAKRLIKRLIKPAANFIAEYIDEETGLPHASYDLWEQVFLTNTYTVAISYAALQKSIQFIERHEPECNIDRWRSTTKSIEDNVGKLFSQHHQWFVRGLMNKTHNFEQNTQLDIASLYGLAKYGPVGIQDVSFHASYEATKMHLVNKGPQGGVIRYEGDTYMLQSERPGNPWYVCTLWLAQVELLKGNVDVARSALDWTLEHATPSGMLSEQIDPDSGELRGVAPLVWSHAEYISLLQALF